MVGNPVIYIDQSPFGYCGEYLDKETNEVYLRARYYDSSSGRFTCEDPQRIQTKKLNRETEAIDGLALNLYGYCNDDPVNHVDPDGESLKDWWNNTKQKAADTFNKAKTSVENWYNRNKAVINVVLAVVVVVAVTAAVVLTAGVALSALGIAATSAVASGLVTGAIAGSLIAGGTNILVQSATKGAENINIGEVALSTAVGGATGAISGAAAGAASAATTATQLMVVQKGFQGGANAVLSGSAYLTQSAISGKQPTLYGYAAATAGGFITGVAFNAAGVKAIMISIGIEAANYGEDLFAWVVSLFNGNSNKQTT